MKRLIETTADGSPTLYVPQLDEHYHSVKGARTESQHIFIEMGLKACLLPAPRVLEVGFGTGLNALLTLEEAERSGRRVHYTGLEHYPLSWDEAEALHYSLRPEFRALHEAPWGQAVELSPAFVLRKLLLDVTRADGLELPGADVVYFDAFAPEKQPEMWAEPVFRRLFACLSAGGILTTYCAKGAVRRLLQAVGFAVERLPGPPGGKREMLRARKP